MELETLMLFATGFIFALFCLTDFKHAIDEKKAPAIGIITGAISSSLWFIFGLLWLNDAASEVFIAIGYLWIVFGFTFLTLTVACVGLLLKYTVTSNSPGKLRLESAE